MRKLENYSSPFFPSCPLSLAWLPHWAVPGTSQWASSPRRVWFLDLASCWPRPGQSESIQLQLPLHTSLLGEQEASPAPDLRPQTYPLQPASHIAWMMDKGPHHSTSPTVPTCSSLGVTKLDVPPSQGRKLFPLGSCFSPQPSSPMSQVSAVGPE